MAKRVHHRRGGRALFLITFCLMALNLVAVGESTASSYPCVPADSTHLTGSVPAWYVPGVTPLCDAAKQALKEEESAMLPRIPTAHWTFYVADATCPAADMADCVRTTPTNADYTANDCQSSGVSYCSEWISWDQSFYSDCGYLGGSEIATRIHYWADRARANGSNWRVYVRTQSGGYPWNCSFSITVV